MKNTLLFLLLFVLAMAFFGWTVGSFAHWFYYTLMIVFSKITFALMYGLPVVIILALIVALFYKRSSDKQ